VVNVVVIEIIIWLLVIPFACVLLTMQLKDTSTVYARRTTSGDFEQDMMGGNRRWIPLKLNASTLYQLSFAQISCFIPAGCGWILSKSDTSVHC
jgi:preprotein translocase subunit SecY